VCVIERVPDPMVTVMKASTTKATPTTSAPRFVPAKERQKRALEMKHARSFPDLFAPVYVYACSFIILLV
jgi:hypothetical protein